MMIGKIRSRSLKISSQDVIFCKIYRLYFCCLLQRSQLTDAKVSIAELNRPGRHFKMAVFRMMMMRMRITWMMVVEFARKAHQDGLVASVNLWLVLIHAGPLTSNHLSSVADKWRCHSHHTMMPAYHHIITLSHRHSPSIFLLTCHHITVHPQCCKTSDS